MTTFNNAEGIWYWRGVTYFTTKADKVVWAYDIRAGTIERLFDRGVAADSSLDAVDNVTVSPTGDVLICEDGGNMEIGIITPAREVAPLIRFEGPDHDDSEVCGVVFSPDGNRLYCTSQRAFGGPGAVYEITGPFNKPQGGVPDDFVFGPPAGEARPRGPLNPGGDRSKPGVRLRKPGGLKRRRLLRRGLTVEVEVEEPGRVAVQLDSPELATVPGKGGSTPRPRNVVLSRGEAIVERGVSSVEVALPKPRGRARKLLGRKRGAVRARVLVAVLDASGNETALTARVRIGPKGGNRPGGG